MKNTPQQRGGGKGRSYGHHSRRWRRIVHRLNRELDGATDGTVYRWSTKSRRFRIIDNPTPGPIGNPL